MKWADLWAADWAQRQQAWEAQRDDTRARLIRLLNDPAPRTALPLSYADMDVFIRNESSHIHPHLPATLQPWLNLSHADGRIRARTLNTLPASIPGTAWALLVLLRLNDWAAPVRLAAQQRLADFTAHTDPAHLAVALAIILPNWASWQRMTGEEQETALHNILTAPVAARLAAYLRERTAGPMTTLLAQLSRVPTLDTHLANIAAHAIQPVLRAKAYQSLLSGEATWASGREKQWIDQRYNHYRWHIRLAHRPLTIAIDREPLLQQAAADRSPIVRRVAGDAIIAALPQLSATTQQLAAQLARDPNPSVAERGAYILLHGAVIPN